MQVKRMQGERNGAGGGEKVRYMGPKVTNGAGYVQLHAPERVFPQMLRRRREERNKGRERRTRISSPPPLIAVPMTATEKKKIEKFSSRLSIFLASVFLMDRWEAISIGIDRRCSDLVPFGPGLSGCKQSKGIFIDVVLCPSLILLSPHFESSSFNSLTRFKFLLFGLIFGRGEIFQSTRNRVQG